MFNKRKDSLANQKSKDLQYEEEYKEIGWSRLITEGEVIKARVNSVLWIGSLLTTVAIGSFVYDIYSNVTAGSPKVSSSLFSTLTSTKAYATNPEEIGKWSKGGEDRNFSQAFMQGTTKRQDYVGFIQEAMKDPTTYLKQAGQACIPIEDMKEEWVNPENQIPDLPRCKFSADNKTIWLASYVNADYRYNMTLGVFRKEDTGWKFYNVDFSDLTSSNSYSFDQFPTVKPERIANQLKQDFPSSVKEVEDNNSK